MNYNWDNAGSAGLGVGWERSKTMTFFYVRILRWHCEWSWSRG